MIAIDIVLESVSERQTYARISADVAQREEDSLLTGKIHASERLAYMSVTKLRIEERHAIHGLGIFLHVKVRVLVVDSSSLVSDANLLHELLTGPILCSKRGLIIDKTEEVPDSEEVQDVNIGAKATPISPLVTDLYQLLFSRST